MSAFKFHLQLLQHIRHPCIESIFVMLSERGLQVNPSIIRVNQISSVVKTFWGLANVQLVRKHGIEIPVPARHEDIRIGILVDTLCLQEVSVSIPDSREGIRFIHSVLQVEAANEGI